MPCHQIEIKDFIIEGLKGKPRTDYRVDVWTYSGQLLCALPSMTYIAKVLPSGLYVISQWIDKDYLAYGIADRYGKILLPCKYGKHHRNQVGDPPFKEVEPGIVYCFEFCEETGSFDESRFYKDVFNGDFYCQVSKDFLVKRNQVETKESYYFVYTIIDRENRKVMCTYKTELSNNLEEVKEGFYYIPISYRSEDYALLISRYGTIKLRYEDRLYDYYSANGYNGEGSDRPFVSENRIIAFEGDENAKGLGHFKNILIYSYSGELIKEYDFKKSPILIKSLYKYGKALCIRINSKSSSLCYLDLDGNEHLIPNKDGKKIRDYSKAEMFMASENTFVINTEEENDGFTNYCGRLMSLGGDVLFKHDFSIEPLAEGLLKFWSVGKGYGIIDSCGNTLIRQKFEYHQFEVVVYACGKYKKYQMYGEGEYEEL